jgi:hypothetical protein
LAVLATAVFGLPTLAGFTAATGLAALVAALGLTTFFILLALAVLVVATVTLPYLLVKFTEFWLFAQVGPFAPDRQLLYIKTHMLIAKRKWLIWGGVLVLVLAVVATAVIYIAQDKSPVPAAIQKSVSFPVYYPDEHLLPAGYTLDTNSFKTPQQNAVLYKVTYGKDQALTFSVQPKVSAEELQHFYENFMPLRTDYKTAVGQAEIGAYNNHDKLQTLVSLPTDSKTWLIITAPADINQKQLKQVLSALRQ